MKAYPRKFCLIFCLIGVFVSGTALATCQRALQNCPANEYNHKGCSISNTFAPDFYECRPCPDLFRFSTAGGTTTIDECFSDVKQCNGVMCNLFYDGHSNCTGKHPEYIDNTLTCIPQTRSCSEFDFTSGANKNIKLCGNTVIGQWSKSDQKGEATWTGNGWNVEGCYLQTDLTNFTTGCGASCARGVVWRIGGKAVWNSSKGRYDINYDLGVDWYYCTECGAGTKPIKSEHGEDSQNDFGCIHFTSSSSEIVCSCEDVSAGVYSTGCDITYSQYDMDVSPGCNNQCPANMTTTTSGASNMDACIPSGNTQYCDNFGCFTLENDPSLCSGGN